MTQEVWIVSRPQEHPSTTMAKRRKLSDLSHEETSTVVDILQRFQNEIDEEDEDGQEVVDALQKVVRKLKEVRVRIVLTNTSC